MRKIININEEEINIDVEIGVYISKRVTIPVMATTGTVNDDGECWDEREIDWVTIKESVLNNVTFPEGWDLDVDNIDIDVIDKTIEIN